MNKKVDFSGKRWTVKELDLLKKYASQGMSVLKQKLPGRSEQAIRVKCCYLHLSVGETYKVIERLYMVV